MIQKKLIRFLYASVKSFLSNFYNDMSNLNFSDNPSDDYNSYYAQVADDAMMGDQDAMDEMYGEFGEGEW